MTISQVLFILMSLVVVVGALLVVTVRNLFHAALFLIMSFFGVVGLYVILEAGFFAAAQFLVYIGAISILIIFAVMLTRGVIHAQRANSQWPAAAIVSAAVFLIIALMLGPVALVIGNRPFGDAAWPGAGSASAPLPAQPVPPTYITDLGRDFVRFDQYAVPFLLMAVLILIAMIGAIWVARDRTAKEVMAERAERAVEDAAELAQAIQEPLPLAEEAAARNH